MCGCGDKNMNDMKKVVVKAKSARSIDDVLDEALSGIENYTDDSIKSRILGLKDAPEMEEEVVVASEDMDGMGESESEEDLDEETKRKLMELLSELG